MAEIKIEKKSPVWPWVLLALFIIAGLIYFLTNKKDVENEVAQTENDTTTVAQVNDTAGSGAINEYIDYVNAGRTMGLDHVYTNGALLKLTSAIQMKANQIGYDVTADLDKVKEHADHITNDPFETTHADHIKSAAGILSGSLAKMQSSKYPALQNESKEVNDAANAIKPGTLTLDQRDAVKNFFNKSAQLLGKMN